MHAEFSNKFGIPAEAASGGMETLYPEYLQKLKKLMSKPPEAAKSR